MNEDIEYDRNYRRDNYDQLLELKEEGKLGMIKVETEDMNNGVFSESVVGTDEEKYNKFKDVLSFK